MGCGHRECRRGLREKHGCTTILARVPLRPSTQGSEHTWALRERNLQVRRRHSCRGTTLPRLQGLHQSVVPESGAGSPEVHQVREVGGSCSQNRLPRKERAEWEVALLPEPVLALPTSNTPTLPAFRFSPYKRESGVGGRTCVDREQQTSSGPLGAPGSIWNPSGTSWSPLGPPGNLGDDLEPLRTHRRPPRRIIQMEPVCRHIPSSSGAR